MLKVGLRNLRSLLKQLHLARSCESGEFESLDSQKSLFLDALGLWSLGEDSPVKNLKTSAEDASGTLDKTEPFRGTHSWNVE